MSKESIVNIQNSPRKNKVNCYKEHSDFKILLVYPNIQQCAMMPYSMGLFTALLKQEEFQVALFDSTFYLNDLNANYEHYQTFVKEFDWAERGVQFKEREMCDDFIEKVSDFEPDLIAVSAVENTYPIGRAMIRALPEKYRNIPVLWGGVFATFAPELILRDDVGNYVCRGEGEHALVEFCRRLCDGKSLHDIPNLWVRQNGQVFKNSMGPMVNLDELPFPDYSLFEDMAIYRAMQGKIWRTLGIESQRGCPNTCTYCNSPSQNGLVKKERGESYYRKKSLKRVREEIDYLNKKHKIELIYWLADTFLALSNREFDAFFEMYTEFKIPFWMNTRPETMTEYRAEKLEEMNMIRMNFGIEHGNPDYRSRMLKRKVSNVAMLKGFQCVSGRKYISVGNCIIGMPEENRSLIFDTIEFTRQIPKDIEKTGAFIFAPYHGTALRDIAVKGGYLDPGVNQTCW